MNNMKKYAAIGLVILAVIVLGLLAARVVSNARNFIAINSDPDSIATNDHILDTPAWTSAPSFTPTFRPTITILIPAETRTPTAVPTQNHTYQQTADMCDVAGFVADITIPDGTEMAPGASFTKTWSLRNDGTCSWNSDYRIYFYSGSQMGGSSSQQLISEEVYPGYSIEVSLELVAPDEEGTYIGYWALENASGNHFGIGIYGEPFYVEIYVSETIATSTSTSEVNETSTATQTPTEATNTPEPTGTPIPDTATPEAPTNTPDLPTETPVPDAETPEPTSTVSS